MAGEYAFVVKTLRKVVPPEREILRGIWRSFLRGAKIGVLGPNGSRKPSLLSILDRQCGWLWFKVDEMFWESTLAL